MYIKIHIYMYTNNPFEIIRIQLASGCIVDLNFIYKIIHLYNNIL